MSTPDLIVAPELPSPHAGSVRLRLGRLASGKAFLFLARLGGAGAGFLVQVLLANAMSAGQLGTFYAASSLAVITGLIAALGYDGTTSRLISRYSERNQASKYSAFLRQARREPVCAGLVLGAGIALFAVLWPGLEEDGRLAYLLAALSIPALVSLRIIGSFAMAFRCFAVGLLPEIVARPVLFLLIVGLLVAGGFELSSGTAVLIFCILAYGAALAQHWPISKELPSGHPKVPPRLSRRWRQEAWPMVAVLMFTALFADFAIVAGSPFLTTSDIAQFGVCIKVAMLVGFAVQITHSLILPDLADAYAHRDRARVRPVLLRAATFPVALSVLALITTWIFGAHFLALFGDEFIPAQGPLLLMIACQALRAVAGPTHNLLMLEGAGKQNFWICVLAGSVLLIANTLLAPMFGLWGSAEAASLAYTVWIIAGAVCLHRLSAPRADLFALLLPRGRPLFLHRRIGQ